MPAVDSGLAIARYFEQCRLAVYDDGYGNKTGGWGHLCPGMPLGAIISQNQADLWLVSDWGDAQDVVDTNVKTPLTSNQRAALTDFVFNVGPGEVGVKDGFVHLKNGGPSSLLALINQGYTLGAVKEFHKWVYAKGQPSAGLVKRRLAEALLFSTRDGDPYTIPR